MVDLAVEVTGLTKSYESLVAVDGLSFSVKSGEVLGLVGPNGAGKTTTLRALAGHHPPTDGRSASAATTSREEPVEAKRRLAFLPDEPRLFDYLTVEEHLAVRRAAVSASPISASAMDAAARRARAARQAQALPGELSRGMKQKLMIACGFIHAPEVLIFDEPLTGLDPLGIRRMKESIIRGARRRARRSSSARTCCTWSRSCATRCS